MYNQQKTLTGNGRMVRKKTPEYDLYMQLATYMRWKHKNLLWRFDTAGLHLTKTQAGKNKAIQRGTGYPDLQILKKVNPFIGMFIELKPDGTRLKKENGEWASTHIAEQADMIRLLRIEGYCANFAVGIDDAIGLIEDYLKG